MALAAILVGAAALTADAADRVSVQLDWVVRGNHAMFFVARDKGYFAENDIEVTEIRKGTGSAEALSVVGAGNADFGFGDLPTLVIARSQSVPVVALAAVNQRSPMGMIALAKTKLLSRPQDLKGLDVGVHAAGSTYVFLRAFLAANGMSEADIKKKTVTPPYEGDLLHGRVAAVPGYIDAEVPELEAGAGGPGSLSVILGADWGYDVYGSGLFTSEALIREKPDLVQRFTAAYLKAFADVIANPGAAADIVIKANPEYEAKRDILVKQLEADITSTFFSAETAKNGIGAMTLEAWSATAKVLREQGVLKKDIDLEAAFSNRFVLAANPLKR